MGRHIIYSLVGGGDSVTRLYKMNQHGIHTYPLLVDGRMEGRASIVRRGMSRISLSALPLPPIENM